MQVVNANKRVSSLEVSTDGGSTWQPTTRQTYNFFENSSGFGTTNVDVKVTSIDGDVVIVKNVDVTPGSVVTASSNFGSSGTVATSAAPIVATSSPYVAPVVIPSSTAEVPVAQPTPTTAAGANFAEYPTQATTYAAIVATTSSSLITPAPTPTPSSAPEIVYVTIEACPA